MKKEIFKLPEKWCITSDEESNEVLCNWYIKYKNTDPNYLDKTVGNHFCMNDTNLQGYVVSAFKKKQGYLEINFDQFKEFVLKINPQRSPKDYNYLLPLLKKLCIK